MGGAVYTTFGDGGGKGEAKVEINYLGQREGGYISMKHGLATPYNLRKIHVDWLRSKR